METVLTIIGVGAWCAAVLFGLGLSFWSITDRLPWPPFRKRP